MNLEILFNLAVKHHEDHGCSAPPYENYEKLFQLVKNHRPKRVLEIGTGIGFTTVVIAEASQQSQIDTLEKDPEHASMAKDFIAKQGLNDRIEIHNVVAEEFLPTLTEQYDLIFFDGFQIHYEFLPHYERLLTRSGILVVGNNHLTSKTSDRFFQELNNPSNWRILEQFRDTIVAERL